LYGDVLSFNVGAVQSLFRASCIFLSPKFHYARVLTEAGLGVRRGECTIRTEEFVEFGIGIALWKMLYETRRRVRRRKRSVGSSWGVWREYEKNGRG